ncbi:hypothetical protein [Amycolatopsis benzoatilytica]|uniref:hypothetical protein n=1 Tax=Amycolatopsis benzoatilytica TaxID=346045 RepID=UPI0003A0692A|nr:hypothetical protein [Amycolatopsis benzoatilytica]
MTNTSAPPAAIRQLTTPDAQALTGLVSAFDDLQTVLSCCERLVAALAPEGERDDLTVESLWTTALLSYARCFASGQLSEEDVTSIKLRGEVLAWHKVLRQLRKHYADPVHNPREQVAVGAAQDSQGHAAGIAVTSAPRASLDDATVRQTGALAYELSRIVERRITEHQERLRSAAGAMSVAELEKLPLIEVSPEQL